MAAIATIHTFGGTGLGGFLASGGAFSESGGAAVPANFAIDSTLIWNTAFTETTAPTTQGTNWKWTFGGGCEDGTVYRLIFDYVDASNFKYCKVKFGGLVIYADLVNDELELWDVSAGIHAQITPHSPVRRGQDSPGDLWFYQLVPGSAISVTKVEDEIVVKFSANDTIDGYNHNTDIILLRATDTSGTSTPRGGFTSMGGSHTTSISLFQGALIQAYFADIATGDNGNSGAVGAPFRTIGKLMNTVDVNQLGFIEPGTYMQSILDTVQVTMKNGTSYEDAPTFVPRGSGLINQVSTNSAGCLHLRSTPTNRARYRVYCGPWKWDGAGISEDCLKVWGQIVGNSDQANKYLRFQEIFAERANGGAGFSWHHNTFYDGGGTFNQAPSAITSETYPHWLWCSSDNNDNLQPAPTENNTHGYYLNDKYICVDGCTGKNNRGAGGKFAHGTDNGPFGLGFQVVEECRLRFFYAYRNGLQGWNTQRGNSRAIGCIFEGQGVGSPDLSGTLSDCHGFAAYFEADDARAIACIAFDNLWTGFHTSAIFNSSANIKFINCTSYGNVYNYHIRTLSGNALTNILWMNCSAYAFASGGADYFSEGQDAQTGEVFTTNHETSSTGFGSVFGDPLFINPGLGDFSIPSNSPLTGAGTDASAYLSEDHVRRLRPQGATWDIGAYEFPAVVENILPATFALTEGVAGALGGIRMAGATISRFKFDRAGFTLTATPSGGASLKGG